MLASFPFRTAAGPAGDLCCVCSLSAGLFFRGRAHLITLLWSLEEQQTLEVVLSRNHSRHKRLQKAELCHGAVTAPQLCVCPAFWPPPVAESRDNCIGHGAGLAETPPGCPSRIPVTGRCGRRERCFRGARVENQTFGGRPWESARGDSQGFSHVR